MARFVFQMRAPGIYIFLMLVFCTGCRADVPPGHPTVEYKKCGYTDIPQDKITCATFITSLTRGRFVLPVAILHGTGKKPEDKGREALVLIPGGPGEGYQVTRDNVEFWLEWMRQANLSRDLILFDPRGTGESSPTWNCAEYDSRSLEWAAKDLDVSEELKLSHPIVKNCVYAYDKWIKDQVRISVDPHPGLGLLSSVFQAADINEMIAALGYEAWHLWGVSYGSRVALLAAKHQKVKSVLLDSPYPLNKGRLSEWPALLDGAMAKHTEIYRALYRKRAKYADFPTLWNKVIHRLDRGAATFSVPYWNNNNDDANYTNETITLALNSDRLISIAYFVLYDTSLWLPFYESLEYLQASLPSPADAKPLLAGGKAGVFETSPKDEKHDSLELILEAFVSSTFDPLFNSMVYFAVECIDNPVDAESDYMAELSRFPLFARFMREDWRYDICRDPIFDNRRSPVSLQPLPSKPTLILGGQYDPVTPKEWGMELQRQLGEKARFHSVGGAGHAVTVDTLCDISLFETFMNGDTVDLAQTCRDVKLTWP